MTKFKHRLRMLGLEGFFLTTLWWLSPWKPAEIPLPDNVLFGILMIWVGIGFAIGVIWIIMSMILGEYD